MANRRGIGQAREVRGITMALAVAAALSLATAVAAAQRGGDSQSPAPPQVKARFLTNHFPDQPSLAPIASIPLVPLGFTAPSSNYLGARNTFVSLDFIDEDRLLFTFRVPGLIHRDLKTGEESNEREIRAVVLKLPQGTAAQVEAEALWTVHDRVRYLWPLKNGHFLLRDRNSLLQGDATLALKPFLDFPGSLLWVELDPAQQFLVTNSREPLPRLRKPAMRGLVQESSRRQLRPQSPRDEDDAAAEDGRPELVVRILRRESGEVMLVSRVRTAVHLPINTAGYLENLRGQGMEWMLNLSYFTGGTKMLGSVDTACDPGRRVSFARMRF